MTNDEIVKMRVELTADILKLLIQEKIKEHYSSSMLSSNPDYTQAKADLVRAASKFANAIINIVVFNDK